jgi:filamentous hemagglutinin
VVQINAANINNLGGSINGDTVNVVAQQDINNTGGSISAVSSLTALAGRDLNIASTVQSTDSAVMQRQDVDRVAGLYVTGATGVLQAGAGRDVNLTAAAIVNSGTGATVVAAGNNLNLNSVQTVDSINATWNAQNYSRYGTQSEVGSAINGGGAVQLVAGNDLTARTATVQATGALSLTAGNDLNILAGQSSQSVAQAYHAEGSGFLKSASVTSRTSMSNTQALASNLDGASVTLQAGKDINVVGSNVLSDTATTLAAGGDIKIAAATETATQSSMFEEKSSGLSFGAMGPSYSKSSSKDTYDATAVTESQSASTIGSRNGTVSITADQDVTVRGSNVVGLGDVSLTATNGAVSVVAAQDSSQTAATHEQSHSSFGGSYSAGVASVGFGKSSASAQSSVESLLHYGSSVVSTDGNTRMQAGQGLSVVASGVSAGQNLTLIGSSVDLSAAQDIVVEHNAQQSSSSGFSVGMTVNPLAAFSSAFKQSASNNPSTSILGKSTKYADATTDGLAAATTTVVVQAGSRSASAAQDHATSTAQVSSLTAGNNLTVLATGSNITSQGATMSSEGDATLVAKDNINLDVAHNYETQGQTSVASGWSIDNRGTMPLGVFDNNAKGNGSSDTVSGSSLSAGRSATLGTTDGDITLTAANVVAQDDLSINAAKNLTIQSGQNSVSNANQTDNQAIGKVVVSDTERFSGYHSENSTGNNNAVTQVASSVGSLQGSVTLAAGETYTQRASNLLAANDIDITAKALDITTANNSGSSAQSSDSLKVGTFSRVSSPLIDLINNAKNAAKSDGRLQAMQTLATAANAYQAYSALNGGSGSIVKAEAGVGFATADSQDQSRYVQAQGSTIQGGGNVNLSSTEGDITATGAKISAGDTLTLDSARDILLTAGKNSVASSGDNHNAGVEVGVGASVGAETGVYVYASASIGSGKYDLNANTNSNTQLSGNTVTLKSQDDTTLKGAEVHANTINADVGGKLAIESVQDTVTQNSEQSSVGGRVQISIGTAWNASANLSQSQGNGSSAIVTSQSGLFAGDGGYHVTADSVALKGGAIASTNAANSELTAQSISFEDIANKMEYSASTMSVSGGYGEKTAKSDTAGSTGSSDPKTASPAQNPSGGSNPSLMPGMIMQESGSSSGTTYATLTEGNIKIGGQSTSAAELGAHTDLATANAAVEALPDVKNLMQEQQAMAAAANTVIATAAQFANDRAAAAANQAKKETEKIAKADQGVADAQKSLNAVLADGASSESDKNNAQQALDTAKQSRDSAQQALTTATAAAANWGPTGDYTRALKAITGVLVGGVAGQSVGQLAANASAPYIANAIGNYFSQPGNENQTAQVLSHAVLGGLLAAANGGSAAGGAVAGAGGELAAQAITKALYPKAFDENGDFHPEKLDDAQKNVVIALSSAVGAMLGGVTGGTTQDALVGANVAANAATNNQLSAKEIDAKLAAIKNCNADTKCVSDVERKYNRLAYLHANGAFNNGVMSKAMLESDRQELQQKLQGGECNMPSACYAEVTRSINEIDSLIASMPGREKALTMLEYASVAVDVGSVLLGIVELRIAAKAAAALGKVATTGGTNSAGVVTSVGTANVASGVKLADDLAANMVKPIVTDTKLSGLMDDLYRDGAKIGTGSTADAVRYETATGTPVGNVFHSQKAQDYSVALQKWLEANPTASFSDRSAAQNVLRDLQNSLKGK